MKFYAWLLQVSLLLFVSAVRAEGGCPPGMIPYSGTNLSSCGPIPWGYYNHQAREQSWSSPILYVPPPMGIDDWGVIATDVDGHVMYVSVLMCNR